MERGKTDGTQCGAAGLREHLRHWGHLHEGAPGWWGPSEMESQEGGFGDMRNAQARERWWAEVISVQGTWCLWSLQRCSPVSRASVTHGCYIVNAAADDGWTDGWMNETLRQCTYSKSTQGRKQDLITLETNSPRPGSPHKQFPFILIHLFFFN